MRKRAWRKTSMRTLPIILMCSSHALASGVDTYRAPAHGEDMLEVERAHPATAHLEPFGRLSLSYAKDPLVLRNDDGTESSVIEHQAGAYGSVGMGLWDRAHVALLVPVHVQSGPGLGVNEMPGLALGDLGLDFRFAIFGRSDALELALATRVLAPTGSESGMVGDGSVSFAARAIASREFGQRGPLVTGSLGTNLRDGGEAVGTSSELLLGLAGSMPVRERWGVGCEGTLASQYDRFLSGKATPAGLLAGVLFREEVWVARLGAGPGVTPGVGSPDFRVVAMVGSAASSPTTPTPAAAHAADRDQDGIDDPYDACLADPEDVDGFQDEDGCPDKDDDADHVPDVSDVCPRVSEDLDSFADGDGCREDDNDGDGVIDRADRCPVEPEDFDSWLDEDGCPDADNDEDGILDPTDQCPSEKETVNGISDEDGCPDLLRVEHAEIRTLEPIYFERGRARVQERSLPLLDEMAAVIIARRDLGNIAIEGHTDDLGSDRFNMKLSQLRAEAVRTYLLERGVPGERIRAAGFGETRPLESNKTKEGRERNRRVEFRLTTESGVDAPMKGENNP
jgi:outer membrane protein OmpA-like peptidoglycan-associated protein